MNMKEDVLRKIHTLGKVGRIVTKVLTIINRILIAVLSVLYICGVIGIHYGFDIIIERNNKISVTMPEEEANNFIVGTIDEDGSLTLDDYGAEYNFDDIVVDGNKVYLTSSNEPDSLSIAEYTVLFIFAGLVIASTLVCLKFGNRFAVALENCESPFQNEIIDNMKKFAISLIPWLVCNATFRGTFVSFLMGADDISLNIDLGCAIVVLIVIILTTIFRYGAILQQESDETL